MSDVFDLVVAEGWLDQITAQRLLQDYRLHGDHTRYKDMRGGTAFWAEAARYNQAARAGLRILGLTDLESAPCAGQLIGQHLPAGLQTGFVLRIAVRMVESWWMADRESLADFLHLPVSRVPDRPDELPHPKRALMALARQSRRKQLREELVPAEGFGGLVGPLYAERMAAYVRERWQPERARARSPSLTRALRAITGSRA